MEWVTTRLRQWLQNGYVEIIELTGYADEDRQPGRTSCTQPFHRLSQLQDSHSQAQESCPSWTMQELPRIIQDRSRLHQGRKEAEVRNELIVLIRPTVLPTPDVAAQTALPGG